MGNLVTLDWREPKPRTNWEIPGIGVVQVTAVTPRYVHYRQQNGETWRLARASWDRAVRPEQHHQPAEVISLCDHPLAVRHREQTPGERWLRANMAKYQRKQQQLAAERKANIRR